MKPVKASLLLHPVFIVGLVVLLLNDFYWKYEYGNWLTGKLSDFAGLVVFPIFLYEVFRNVSRISILVFTAVFFTWWKSPLSQPLIHFFSSLFDIELHRTIDYSDLMALMVLPLVYVLRPVSYPRFPRLQKLLKFGLGATAFFAICADTPYRILPYEKYTPREVKYTEEFCWRGSEQEILQDLQNKGLSVKKETERYYPLSSRFSDLFYQVRKGDSTVWKQIPYGADSIIYVKDIQYYPNYIVAEYNYEGQTFKNIRFRLAPDGNDKKVICATLISFDSEVTKYETYPDRKTRKSLKPYFESLFGIKRK